ncbi:MAG: Ig-like domain-containing protein [Thermoanaerobaculia bacterium]
MTSIRTAVVGCCLLLLSFAASAQNLEIHYINVGWGSSVLVKGPDGTTVLLEAGDTGKGTSEVVPYLQSVGIAPANGLDYIVGGHQHCDHIGGLDEVINAGYDVRVKQYQNGSTYTSSCVDGWTNAAATTTAGRPVTITPGTVIPLGNGATLTCVAVNGKIIGGGTVAVSDENDRSIAMLLQYGGFDWLWASDVGGGSIDNSCTGRSTGQTDVESSIVLAISPGGAYPLITTGGIDVLNVNHHGSESSTNNNWMDYSVPAVAIVAVGSGQTTGWDLPRIDVVENVLLGQASACVSAPPTFVLQTEEGSPSGTLTSKSGYCVGNIKIVTDGLNIFTVSADGQVNQGPNEIAPAGLPRSFTIDDAAPVPDTEPPSTSITAPSTGSTVSGTVAVSAGATDNIGVTQVEFYLDGALKATDSSAPYSWSWDTTTATNASHGLTSKAYDAAGNSTTSAAVNVTVSNTAPPQPVGTDISGWRVAQANASGTFVLPTGTVIPDHGYVVIGRNATKAAFEAFWGVTLQANVVYIDSGDAMPVINGGENFTLYNASGQKVDGRTVSMPSSAGRSFQRLNPCGSASKASSWANVGDASGNPGSGAASGCAKGVIINEFSDATGTGNYVYEFIELHNDR